MKDQTEIIDYVQHNLTADELAWLINRTPNGKSCWRWIRHNDQRLTAPAIEHDGQRITSARCDEAAGPATIVRAVLETLQRRHARRSQAARQAAKTRARRKQREVYRIAAALQAGGVLPPGRRCRICGRALNDPESFARGIGSDCWQSVLQALEEAKRAAT